MEILENSMNNTMFREFATVNDVMNRFFERQAGAYDYARHGGSNTEPAKPQMATTSRLPIDIQAKDDVFLFTAYLPGVKPEAVEITFEKDELTIKGQFPQKDEGNGYIRNELFHGAFERKLTFNTAVNTDAIEAHFENGVLTLRVPKAEEAKPKKIAVAVR